MGIEAEMHGDSMLFIVLYILRMKHVPATTVEKTELIFNEHKSTTNIF